MSRLIAGLIIGMAILTMTSVAFFTGSTPSWPEPEDFQSLTLSVLLQAYTALLMPLFAGVINGNEGLAIFAVWVAASSLAGLTAGKLSTSIKLALIMPSFVILLWFGLTAVVFAEVYGPQSWLVEINAFLERIAAYRLLNLLVPYLLVLAFSGVFGFLSSAFLARKKTVTV
ncbi:MAG: hypothetical protein QXO01_04125 [Nitrososphaerota archaeon]